MSDFFKNSTGALVQGGADLINSAANAVFGNWQSNKAYRRQLHFWNLQNEYNTPLNQVNRLRAAGLSPTLMYSNGMTNTASTAPSVNAASGNPFSSSNLGAANASYRQSELLDAQKDLVEQQAKEKKLDNQLKEQTLPFDVQARIDTAHILKNQAFQSDLTNDIVEADRLIKWLEYDTKFSIHDSEIASMISTFDANTIEMDNAARRAEFLSENLDGLNNAQLQSLYYGFAINGLECKRIKSETRKNDNLSSLARVQMVTEGQKQAYLKVQTDNYTYIIRQNKAKAESDEMDVEEKRARQPNRIKNAPDRENLDYAKEKIGVVNDQVDVGIKLFNAFNNAFETLNSFTPIGRLKKGVKEVKELF